MIYKYALIACMVLLSGSAWSQQVSESALKQEVDSSQRVFLHDSLGVDNLVITRLFSLQEDYFLQARQIRMDGSNSASQQGDALLKLRQKTNTEIRKLLGEPVYEKLSLIIRERSDKRNKTLASEAFATEKKN